MILLSSYSSSYFGVSAGLVDKITAISPVIAALEYVTYESEAFEGANVIDSFDGANMIDSFEGVEKDG